MTSSLSMFHASSFSPLFIARVSSHFFQSRLYCSCFISFPSVHTSLIMFHYISFSSQSISFISSTIVHLIHVYLIWLHSHYMVIQPYCQFHFSAILSLEINDLRVSLDTFLILDRYLFLEVEFQWFYYSLSLYIKQEIQHGVRRNVLVYQAADVYLLIYSTQAYVGKQ